MKIGCKKKKTKKKLVAWVASKIAVIHVEAGKLLKKF